MNPSTASVDQPWIGPPPQRNTFIEGWYFPVYTVVKPYGIVTYHLSLSILFGAIVCIVYVWHGVGLWHWNLAITVVADLILFAMSIRRSLRDSQVGGVQEKDEMDVKETEALVDVGEDITEENRSAPQVPHT